MQRMLTAKSDFESEYIVQRSKTLFSVKSKGAAVNPDGSDKFWYNVRLGD